jgi:hypothetical protein
MVFPEGLRMPIYSIMHLLLLRKMARIGYRMSISDL